MPPRVTTPCPELSITVDVPAEGDAAGPLPSTPGVFAFETGDGSTVAIAVTADVRRRVRAWLAPVEDGDRPSRRIDYRAITRRVRAVPVASTFEADWAYLQLARRHLPTVFRPLLDRWQAWFVAVDPEREHPRFTKFAAGHGPDLPPGRRIGPVPDKHAAQRLIDVAEDLFDLCRYHHILVQAPHGTACAYKEMGRCPAPCDGTIPMADYVTSINAATAFLLTPIAETRARWEEEMQTASDSLDFEAAARLRRRCEALAALDKPAFAHLDDIAAFRFVALTPSERAGWVRLFLIHGGWIEPWADVKLDIDRTAVNEIFEQLVDRFDVIPLDLSGEGLENLGLVCWHLFRGRADRDIRWWRPGANGADQSSFCQLLRAFESESDITDATLEQSAT